MTSFGTKLRLLALTFAIFATPALAGPPYVTDDPIPPEVGEFEIYTFAAGTHGRDGTEGEAAFDINYGLAKDVQFTVGLPLEFEDADGARADAGTGDVELAVKYMFLKQHEDGSGVNVAFYPSMTLPTGSHRFTSDKVGAFFPIWAQKDIGPWSIFGGGGYHINPGVGNEDFWEEGIAVTRQMSQRLNLGIEFFHEGKDEFGGKSATGMQIGGEYELNDHWALLAAGGPLLSHRAETGHYTFYIGVGFTG